MADDSAAANAWFAVPAPVRRLFRRFPLHTHPPDALPARAPGAARSRARLFVFVAGDTRAGPPSHNPSCLKWQTYLRIAGVDVDLVPSNNHASPSGALPFLLPAASDPRPDVPLTGPKIAQYARDRAAHPLPERPPPARCEAYRALLAHAVRPVWLHALYLDPTNTPLLSALYLPPSSLVRAPLARTLRDAAAAQILAATRRSLIDPAALLADAAAAFRALSILLADHACFFGANFPGLFDAEVFAYIHLILGPPHLPGNSPGIADVAGTGLGWGEHGRALRACLAGFENLVAHRDALYKRCWGNEAEKGVAI